jgi:prepilin-type processing-associated H-X9-DG protein
MLNRGYNTNYAASWFLIRGSVRLSMGPNDTWSFIRGAPGNARGLAGTTGPLTQRILDLSDVPASTVPFLGDAALGDLGTSLVNVSVAMKPATYYGGPTSDPSSKMFFEVGDRLTVSCTRGPMFLNMSTGGFDMLPSGTDLTAQVRCERDKTPALPIQGAPGAGHGWVQDTRGWYPTHGKDCNMLMADGSVHNFPDENNDKFLNPGFVIPMPTAGFQPGGEGELKPEEVFSGLFLEKYRPAVQ